MFKLAIVWALAAGPSTQAMLAPKVPDDMSIRASGPMLEVDRHELGRHILAIRTLGGKRVAERIGWGPAHYSFPSLQVSAPYTLIINTASGQSVRMVKQGQ